MTGGVQGPPSSLIARVGGTDADYAGIGAAHRAFIESVLPGDWSFEGKRVLDFGCGAGRTLEAFRPEAESGGDFWGSDIHAPSIEWAERHLSPPFSFFLNDETPPLDQPDASFDLVYAMSVFTHIGVGWAPWIAEMNRIVKPGGYAVFTFLGEGMWPLLTGREWDPERIGIISAQPGADWEVGGPNVFHSEWWLREHWGRAFEIVEIRPFFDPESARGHGFISMRRGEHSVTAEELAAVDPGDPREIASLELNVELLCEEGAILRSRLEPMLHRTQASGGGGGLPVDETPPPVDAPRPAAGGDQGSDELERLRAERDRLSAQLRSLSQSKSWRATAPLRRAADRFRSR
jgi:SAM-dependent methyltransferase